MNFQVRKPESEIKVVATERLLNPGHMFPVLPTRTQNAPILAVVGQLVPSAGLEGITRRDGGLTTVCSGPDKE